MFYFHQIWSYGNTTQPIDRHAPHHVFLKGIESHDWDFSQIVGNIAHPIPIVALIGDGTVIPIFLSQYDRPDKMREEETRKKRNKRKSSR